MKSWTGLKARKPEWPGIATAAMLLCIVAIVIAIALDPNFKLKDWQTFMAACIALIGGTMAYRGAMAKVQLDRELANYQQRRHRLTLMLKLQLALELFASEVKRQRLWADVPIMAGIRKVSVSDFTFDYPPELQQAWDNLDLFGSEVVTALANIRSTTRTIDGSNRIWGDRQLWEYDWLKVPMEIRNMIKILSDLETYCWTAARGLERETEYVVETP